MKIVPPYIYLTVFVTAWSVFTEDFLPNGALIARCAELNYLLLDIAMFSSVLPRFKPSAECI